MKIAGVSCALLLCAGIAHADDPLASKYFPSFDQNSANYASYITLTDSLYKVFQSSTLPTSDHWLTVYAMKNEIQSFQVHVKPAFDITSMTVTMGNLTNAQTGTVISSNTTDIVVYREGYINISTITGTASTIYGVTGYMPDPLIPAVDPYYHQTTNAFPVAVTSGNVQSAWIDVHIPTSAPSGYYSGIVTVSSGSTVLSTMTVVYAVWAWLMPSTASLASIYGAPNYNSFCNYIYGSYAACGAYPDAGGSGDLANTLINIDAAVQALDNRITLAGVSNIYPDAGSFSNYSQYIGPLMDGKPAHVSTILPGAAMSTNRIVYTAFNSSVWSNWASTFSIRGWSPRLFTYLCDEPPNGCSWAQIISSGTASRSYSTPIIPNLVTIDLATAKTNGAEGEIDWITPNINVLEPQGSGNTRSSYNSYLALSSGTTRLIGAYQSCMSAGPCANGTLGYANSTWPNVYVDGKPTANRVMQWLDYMDSLNFELYYAIDYCVDHNCPTTTDPWAGVYAYGAQGDGTLMYPCSSTKCGTSGGNPIWAPSIRLKQIRDGMQDYEYLHYLDTQGQTAVANTQASSWITNAYTFSTDPTKLASARTALGNAIHQITYPTGATGNAGTVTGKGVFSGGGTLQ